MFDAGKTRMIALPYGEKYDNMLRCFYLIPERDGQTGRQTDGRTDGVAISISRDHTDSNTQVISIFPRWGHFPTVGAFSHKFSIAPSGETTDQIKKG